MKKLLCGDRCQIATVDSRLAPVLLSLEPYVGAVTIRLEIPKVSRGVAYHVEKGQSFPKVVCFKESIEIHENTFFIMTHEEEVYTTYFCLSHKDHIISLKGDGKHIFLKGVSGSSRDANSIRPALISMQGSDLQSVVQKTLWQALLVTGGLGKPVQDKTLPRWKDQLGWYADGTLDHDTILANAQQMLELGYPIGFVLITEGWQESALNPKTRRGPPMLLSFRADPERFPEDLSGLIEGLHECGIPHVGMWHGMMGCRGGIHPQLAKQYDLPPDNEGRYFLGYDLGRTFQFYHDYYGHLREEGVSFVKVGDQSSPFSFCRAGMDVTALYKNLQTAMQAAGSVHFHSSQFNGDCLLNPNLFYWGSSDVAEVADTPSIKDHLQNSFWLQYLAFPDHGVFEEVNECQAIFHALSGSLHQVKTGDEKKHRFLEKMILPSGRMLQPDQPLTLCADGFFVNPETEKVCCKTYTMKGDSGIMAVFNLNAEQKTVQGRMGPQDIPHLIEERYAVLSHKHGFLGVFGRDERFSVKLAPEEADVFTFAPVERGVAVLGCYRYYLSPGPIVEVDIEEEHVHISTLIGSPLLLYCEHDILEVRRNGETVPWEYDSQACTLSINAENQPIKGHVHYSIIFS